MYAAKPQIFQIFPSVILMIMGFMDCATTAVGVLYFGAAEANPCLAGIVNTSVPVFLVIKIAATILIAFTFALARRTLNNTTNKESRSFRYSRALINISYIGLVTFLIVVVTNNLTVLLL